MVEENNLESKLGEEKSFLEKVLDASGAAIGTSMLLKALVAGASYGGIGLSYLIPYGIFKGIKYFYNAVTKPESMFSLKGVGYVLKDGLNVLPVGERKVPACVGAAAFGTNYLLS